MGELPCAKIGSDYRETNRYIATFYLLRAQQGFGHAAKFLKACKFFLNEVLTCPPHKGIMRAIGYIAQLVRA
ncbi:MAG TPA: hypothetical protein DCE25_02085 [Pseudomonas sp.]|nr:hypothetical protein [Pseudomonas sp.]